MVTLACCWETCLIFFFGIEEKNMNYKVVKSLAHGKDGTEIYLAEDQHVPRQVVLKVIYFDKHNQAQLDQIHQEIDVQKDLDHPHIIKLLDVSEDFENHRIILVFEYAERGDLYVNIDKLSEDKVVEYIIQVIHGLMYCHEHYIWHQDIKPENIVMTNEGLVKIIDFGWAARVTPPQTSSSWYGGTLDYLAPELILGKDHDHTIDIWCLGITCYEWLVGAPPFESDSRWDTYDKIKSLEYSIPDHVSPEAKDFIQKLIVLDPAQRMSLNQALQHPFLEKKK